MTKSLSNGKYNLELTIENNNQTNKTIEPPINSDDTEEADSVQHTKDFFAISVNSKDIPWKTFLALGSKYTGRKASDTINVKIRRFKNLFEVTPDVCSIIWNKIWDKRPAGFKPIHLLWGLAFLKQYTTGLQSQSVFKADERTMRTWIWIAVDLLSNLEVIDWQYRKRKSVDGQTAFCSLDSVDFKIKEPKPFSPKWHSVKLRAPGLRYEIGICIQTGHIVWKNTGYPCGDKSDIAMARESYTLGVDLGEKTFAKKQYRNEQFFILPNETNKSEHDRIMARHSELCQRFKRFQVLKQPYRHNLEKHTTVFNAVINVIQLMLENGFPLSVVDCSDQCVRPEENVQSLSTEEVWIKAEPTDDIATIGHTTNNGIMGSSGIIKNEPLDQDYLECIKSEITLGDYECSIPSTCEISVVDEEMSE